MHTIQPWLLVTCEGIIRILIAVSLGVAIGTVFECRNGVKYISFLAKPLLRLSRLPEICGTAFLTAFFSNIAASGMLAGAYNDNKITRRDMIIGAVINSFPAYAMIMIFVMFILIPMIGKIAVIYCIAVIVLDLIRTIVFVGIIRFLNKRSYSHDYKFEYSEPLPWNKVFKKAKKRTFRIVKKFALVAIPLYILITYLVHIGLFAVINKHLPDFFATFVPPEIMSIIVAKLAGLTTAATVAMGMLQMSKITILQVLLAFFAGNILNIPIRSIKHNLPIMLGIYPGKNGLWIVLISESSRMLMSLLAVIVLGMMIYAGC